MERYESNRTRFVAAHDGQLACLTLSSDGAPPAPALVMEATLAPATSCTVPKPST